MMPEIIDSHGSGTLGVFVDEIFVVAPVVVDVLVVGFVGVLVVVDALGEVFVSGLVVAEVCTEMD
jgi:hypothetical protein